MTDARQPYDGVVVAAPATAKYVRFSKETAHWWIARALKASLEQAGLAPGDIDGLAAASFTLFPDTAVGLTQHLGLELRWLDHIVTGGASGVTALRRAARAVQSGDADIVACVAGDANHVDSFRRMLSSFSRFAQDASYPYGSGGPNACFALLTDHYMRRHGATREDFGKLCVAQRANALRAGAAILERSLTMADYLAGRAISDPITLFDCVMPVAGAEAFLVMREADARAAGLPHAHIRATIERHNAYQDDPIQMRGGWAAETDAFYAMADCRPEDVDVLTTYDDYPVIMMIQFEDLGFCAKGAAPEFVRAHAFEIDGDLPHNTSGGQLSAGQAGAAGGFLGLVETIRQVTGQAGDGQVTGARLGLSSGFGVINYDRGVSTGAAILSGA